MKNMVHRLRRSLSLGLFLIPIVAQAQFVWPKEEYHKKQPGIYTEDPFIVKYRQEFFAVFKGDYPRFKKAYAEIRKMVADDPKDARALVWLGNGDTVQAGLLLIKGKKPEALDLLKTSREHLDAAVALRPQDPNIYMMQAATLYIQGQYFPNKDLPKTVWEELRDDCLKFIAYMGPVKMKGVSIHVRGEAYGELGIAYARLNENEKARKAFETVVAMNPDTDYSAKATKEIAKLGKQ